MPARAPARRAFVKVVGVFWEETGTGFCCEDIFDFN